LKPPEKNGKWKNDAKNINKQKWNRPNKEGKQGPKDYFKENSDFFKDKRDFFKDKKTNKSPKNQRKPNISP